jgi:hypothetical protein
LTGVVIADERDPALSEMDVVYPELRTLKTLEINSQWAPADFGDYSFGPIQWSNPYTATRVPGGQLPDGCTSVITKPYQPPCSTAYFDQGGAGQEYPPSPSYVNVTGAVTNDGDTDTIYFRS